MSLDKIMLLIKNMNKEDIIFKPHSKDRIIQRNLSLETIEHYILYEEILGIHNQDNNVYKLWFRYNKVEDLTIVANIIENKIIIITTIKENNTKRLKNGKKRKF